MTPTRPAQRGAFVVAAVAYIAFNVIASMVGVVAKLPDVTTTHAKTDNVPLGQVLFPDGTIISPPLALMVIAGLLLWGALNHRVVVSRVCTALLILGVALTSIAEVTGLADRPSLCSPAKWHVAVVVGSTYGVIGFVAVVAGVVYLFSTLASRRRVPNPAP